MIPEIRNLGSPTGNANDRAVPVYAYSRRWRSSAQLHVERGGHERSTGRVTPASGRPGYPSVSGPTLRSIFRLGPYRLWRLTV